jgi:hypothetical protein
MTPPDTLDQPEASRPGGLPWSEADGSGLKTELLHRHLLARLAVARDSLRALEDSSPAPEVLVSRFGVVINEAQRVIEAERAEALAQSEALDEAVDARVVEIIAHAVAEADALRAVASSLRDVPVAGAAS